MFVLFVVRTVAWNVKWHEGRKDLNSTKMEQRGKNPGQTKKKNLGGGEIFRTLPDRSWGLPSLLYNGYRFSFPGIKRPGRGVDHPPSSSAEVKERVELYLYSPSGPSWSGLGRTLPFYQLYCLCSVWWMELCEVFSHLKRCGQDMNHLL
jgi:hypothetical protein